MQNSVLVRITNKWLALLLVVVLMVTAVAVPGPTPDITGTVVEAVTLNPIGRARVTLQGTDVHAITAPDGTFVLDGVTDANSVIVGARKGYFNEGVTVSPPATGVTIELEPVPLGTNTNYSFVDSAQCGFCHPDQYSQWVDSPMSKAGTNTWVYDIFDGTGSTGGMGGFVYTRDSVHASHDPESDCAACHQPEPWIKQPFNAMDPIGNLSDGALHGVSCEVCHKIAHVDTTKINFPGIYPGAVDFNLPDDPVFSHQVEYGVLADATFETSLMRPSFQHQLVAEACAACHQDKNDPDADGDFEGADGVISEPTYLEWKQSPYSDTTSPIFASCVTCHMPAYGATEACQVGGFTPPQRDPDTIRGHRIEGTTPAYLENAVELTVVPTRDATGVDVEIKIDNTMTGHHVPTGVTVRNMILVVEAVRTSDGAPMVHAGTQTVHALGGVGDPAQGYYAGLPGKFYAKVNHDATGAGPTFFTDATGIQFDNRIPALQADVTNYRFDVPAGSGEVEIRARLIYRRAFRFLVDAKQWTTDGHGNPLADVAAPHYGHLMESVTANTQEEGPGVATCVSDPNSTGSPGMMSARGSASIAANDLVLTASNVPNGSFGLFLVGPNPGSTPLANGTLCIANPQGRYPLFGPVTGNVVDQAVDVNAVPGAQAVSAGDTLLFQAWFRDPDGGGARIDLTDAYQVTFMP